MELPSEGNLAHAIVDILADDYQRREELVELTKCLLDQAINNQCIGANIRAKIIGLICWKHGLEPPKHIRDCVLWNLK